ncbi:MAG TPA: energy-converting hydrogenase B subunit G, EhbG [Methanobacterium sp.]|nr:energy-converting hydrogenase B subunit G, EhbG [Methanobacterium sp.]
MSFYDIIIKRIREIQEKAEDEEPITNVTASAMLTAELTLIATVLIAVVMIRLVHPVLMIVMIIAILIIALMAMPIMPKLRREQSDSLNNMIFYVVLALGLIIALFYWGNLNV